MKMPQTNAQRAKLYRDRKREQKAASERDDQDTITVTVRAFWEREPDEEIQQIFDECQEAVSHWGRPRHTVRCERAAINYSDETEKEQNNGI